jgi:hypothetical protein
MRLQEYKERRREEEGGGRMREDERSEGCSSKEKGRKRAHSLLKILYNGHAKGKIKSTCLSCCNSCKHKICL